MSSQGSFTSSEGSVTPSEGSVTCWIANAKKGDHDAIDNLWVRLFRPIVRLASRQLPGNCKRAADEEDIAISVFEGLRYGIQEGRFKRLKNRRDLWKIIQSITHHKTVDLIRRELAQKRPGGGEPSPNQGQASKRLTIDQVVDQVPGTLHQPDEAIMLTDALEYLMMQLNDREREVVRLRLEGYDTYQIAQQKACCERTVRRKLENVRQKWEKLLRS